MRWKRSAGSVVGSVWCDHFKWFLISRPQVTTWERHSLPRQPAKDSRFFPGFFLSWVSSSPQMNDGQGVSQAGRYRLSLFIASI